MSWFIFTISHKYIAIQLNRLNLFHLLSNLNNDHLQLAIISNARKVPQLHINTIHEYNKTHTQSNLMITTTTITKNIKGQSSTNRLKRLMPDLKRLAHWKKRSIFRLISVQNMNRLNHWIPFKLKCGKNDPQIYCISVWEKNRISFESFVHDSQFVKFANLELSFQLPELWIWQNGD